MFFLSLTKNRMLELGLSVESRGTNSWHLSTACVLLIFRELPHRRGSCGDATLRVPCLTRFYIVIAARTFVSSIMCRCYVLGQCHRSRATPGFRYIFESRWFCVHTTGILLFTTCEIGGVARGHTVQHFG